MFFFLEKVDGQEVDNNKKIERLSLLTEEEMRIVQNETTSSKFDFFGVFKFYPRMAVMLPFIGVVGFVIGYFSTSLSSLIE